MPRLTHPDGQSDEVSAVFEAIGNRARAAICHALAEQPGQTRRELAQRIGAHVSTVAAHLDLLRKEGLVTAEPDRLSSSGPLTARWALDDDVTRRTARTLYEYVTGDVLPAP